MGQISIDCPNCSTSRANFSTHKSRVIKYNFGTMYATCALCNDGVIIWLEAISSREFGHPENYLDINFLDDYIITSISPEPSAIAEVENLPPNVEGTLFEAEHAFSSSLFSAAAGMYRKAIERTLKLNWSELEGSLAQRIKQLGESNEIPNQLVDLLNAVRFLGNDAMHEEVDPTKDEVEAGREFTILFLIYVFELPMKIERALNKYQTKPK